MKFRTECVIDNDGLKLNPELPVTFAGSCFADNISARMRRCLWNAANPLGVLFNPLSIARAIELCILDPDPDKTYRQSLFNDRGITHSWLFDSGCSARCESESVDKFQKKRREFAETLMAGRTLVVTFGTAFCYFKADRRDEVVANCHKQPACLFERRRITVEETVAVWSRLLDRLEKAVEGITVIMTVSPVRHVRDGLHENNLSKSTLLLAIDSLCGQHGFCHYFPAYEIVSDDLRDYRFYGADLVHPSEQAVEYIWEKFRDSHVDDKGLPMLKEGESIARRIAHRHILATDTAISDFRKETERLLEDFMQRHPAALRPALDD